MTYSQESKLWICDRCNGIITDPKRARVEWLSDKENYLAQQIMIVCDGGSTGMNCSLEVSQDFDREKYSHTGKKLSDFVGRAGVDSVFNYLGIGEFTASQAKDLVCRLMFGDAREEEESRLQF